MPARERLPLPAAVALALGGAPAEPKADAPDLQHAQEKREMLGIVQAGWQWNSHPTLSNFMMWNGTQSGRRRRAIICAMNKVGTTTLQAAGFAWTERRAAAAALVEAETVRAVLVRNPFERFVSWYSDKIAEGEGNLKRYNALLLRKHDAVKYPAAAYARAIAERPSGAWDLEYHIAPMTKMCHLGILRYDVLGTLEAGLTPFWRELSARDASLPPAVRNASVRVHTSEHAELPDYCEVRHYVRIAYAHDFAWLRKFGNAVTRDYACHRLSACRDWPNATEADAPEECGAGRGG